MKLNFEKSGLKKFFKNSLTDVRLNNHNGVVVSVTIETMVTKAKIAIVIHLLKLIFFVSLL
ncbi:Uncharacterised protein [Mycoplasma putrefaciens]|nr:Uncharacterised protein [Mycoplasma putrefaciens]